MTYDQFKATAATLGLGDLIERVEAGYCEDTPGGGVHWLYRCDEIGGNTKLACRPKRPEEKKHQNDNVQTLIETRGEGGYAVLAPSYGNVHDTGRPYVLRRGGFATIARISAEERRALWDLAETFDQMPDRESAAREASLTDRFRDDAGDITVIEDFNRRAVWADLLEAEGWALVFERGAVGYWRRPGKDRHHSATTNIGGSDRFCCFSSSTTFKTTDRKGAKAAYSKFAFYAHVNHGDDFKAAVRDLGQKGYGAGERRNVVTRRRDRGVEPVPGAAALRELGTSAAPDPPTSEAFPLTDLGNAERLIARHGRDLLYCHAWGKYLTWTGQRWEPDSSGRVVGLMKDTVRAIYAEAAEADGDEKRKAISSWAMKSEAEPRINAAVSLARSEVPVSPPELDADGWLLNVLNGTLDLRTGELRPHRREDQLTKLARVEFDSAADCPTWLAFLERVMGGSAGLLRFLQRAVGYSLTGDTREQALFLFYGTGANGKSTFLETIAAVLGDYAQHAEFSTFLAKRHDTVRNDLADLFGARFVSVVEIEGGRRLAEAMVKQVTGGDTIKARFLFQEYFTFRPTFKVFLAANHKPVIRGTDNGIWRRIRLVPFGVQIPKDEQDKDLAEKLRGELPGILAWAVRGCLEWQRDGLGVPHEVDAATGQYRAEMDVLGDFLVERCMIEPGAWVLTSDLYKAYIDWCEQNGEKPIAKNPFSTRLAERGLASTRGGKAQARGWSGLRLLTVLERQTQTQADAVSGKAIDNSSHEGGMGNSRLPVSVSADGRETRCWQCGRELSSESDSPCSRCEWLVCSCGACSEGCTERDGRRDEEEVP